MDTLFALSAIGGKVMTKSVFALVVATVIGFASAALAAQGGNGHAYGGGAGYGQGKSDANGQGQGAAQSSTNSGGHSRWSQ
jgi:opacity protein-like surface antigen